MTSRSDMVSNVSVISTLATNARARGAEVLFLPECFNFFGDETISGAQILEPLGGPALSKYRSIAVEQGIWLSLGGFQERASSNASAKGHNTHVVIDAAGRIAGVYRKAHLFDLELPGLRLKESESTAPGTHLTVCDSPAGRIGLSVCYDVRFPEMYRALTLAGAQILAVPAAFTVPTGAAHWETLLRARAIENQCYVVASAQVGSHNSTRTSYGHAMVIDPWGTVVAQCGGPETAGSTSPCIVTAEISLDLVADVRSRMPVQSHLRPALYSVDNVRAGKDSVCDADGQPL